MGFRPSWWIDCESGSNFLRAPSAQTTAGGGLCVITCLAEGIILLHSDGEGT